MINWALLILKVSLLKMMLGEWNVNHIFGYNAYRTLNWWMAYSKTYKHLLKLNKKTNKPVEMSKRSEQTPPQRRDIDGK